MRIDLITKEYPPHIYGGAGVHVAELVKVLRKTIEVKVRCFGEVRDESDTYAYSHPADFDSANPALQTMATDLAMVSDMASTDPRLEVALAFPRVYAASGAPKRDPGTGEAIDPRTGRLESESIEHALPAVMVELDQLRAARQRALSAGDFGAAVALGAEVRGVESRKQGNDADGTAALEALDRHPALVGRT